MKQKSSNTTNSVFALVKNIARYYIFWLLLFALFRLIFIGINFSLISDAGAGFSELLPMLWVAIPLDFSMASYFVIITTLLLTIGLYIKKPWWNYIIHALNYFFILANSLLLIGEIGLYPEWKMKVNAKALEYLLQPQEIISSNKTSDTIWQFILLAVVLFAVVFVYRKWIVNPMRKSLAKPKWFFAIPVGILMLGIEFIGMRGGIQDVTINQSQSYYSKIDVVNDISVNTAWNLLNNILNSNKITDINIFKTADEIGNRQRVIDMHQVSIDTTIHILNQPKPNVLIILLEGWSADLVGSLAADRPITPQLDLATKDGLLFTRMYANGNRSQQGIAAILGGFPALPITTLTAIPEKMRQTTTITSQFTENGYHTAFYYGGELRFANLKAYFIHNGFDEILGDGDWDSSIPKGKLGIHDEYMYTILEEKLSTAPTPFFVNFFTLSSHSPYDQPFPQRIDWNDTEDDYHNSVLYGDSCLGDFLTKAKASEWYANTLIVIVSDHSHQAYTHRPISTAEYRHIPMLITGGALAKHFRGKTFDQIASQVDIGKTLLNQLNFNSDSLFWSKDLMNPYSPKFAYFELNTGFGWISKDGYVAYDILNGIELQNTYNNDSLKEINYHYGKAYLQEVFQEFIDL